MNGPRNRRRSLKKSFAFAGLTIFVVGTALALRPVPIVSLSKCTQITGVLVEVSENGTNDLCLQIENVPGKRFYINRGLEAGLDVARLNTELLGQEMDSYAV